VTAADDDEAPGWQPVTMPALLGVLGFALAVLWFGHTGERWFPLLDGANLLFHEAGHPLAGLLSERLAVYGGTLAQLAFPLAAAWHFRRRGATASFAACLVWLSQNLFNIARYVGDARAKALPLVGGRDPEDAHDWAEILARWGLLQADTRLAGFAVLLGWLGILASVGWLGWRWWSERA
jgi:hypothetical protein